MTARQIHTPPEYRPLLPFEARRGDLERIGYTFAALRRELDWHTAASSSAGTKPDRYAATVCALHVRDSLEEMARYVPTDMLLEQLAEQLAATTVTTDGGFSYPVDPDQLDYRADAAARVRLIARNLTTI